jgi:hypothetical protein
MPASTTRQLRDPSGADRSLETIPIGMRVHSEERFARAEDRREVHGDRWTIAPRIGADAKVLVPLEGGAAFPAAGTPGLSFQPRPLPQKSAPRRNAKTEKSSRTSGASNARR